VPRVSVTGMAPDSSADVQHGFDHGAQFLRGGPARHQHFVVVGLRRHVGQQVEGGLQSLRQVAHVVHDHVREGFAQILEFPQPRVAGLQRHFLSPQFEVGAHAGQHLLLWNGLTTKSTAPASKARPCPAGRPGR